MEHAPAVACPVVEWSNLDVPAYCGPEGRYEAIRGDDGCIRPHLHCPDAVRLLGIADPSREGSDVGWAGTGPVRMPRQRHLLRQRQLLQARRRLCIRGAVLLLRRHHHSSHRLLQIRYRSPCCLKAFHTALISLGCHWMCYPLPPLGCEEEFSAAADVSDWPSDEFLDEDLGCICLRYLCP